MISINALAIFQSSHFAGALGTFNTLRRLLTFETEAPAIMSLASTGEFRWGILSLASVSVLVFEMCFLPASAGAVALSSRLDLFLSFLLSCISPLVLQAAAWFKQLHEKTFERTHFALL